MFHPHSNRRKRRKEGRRERKREWRREGRKEGGNESRVSHIFIGKCWTSELYLHSLNIICSING